MDDIQPLGAPTPGRKPEEEEIRPEESKISEVGEEALPKEAPEAPAPLEKYKFSRKKPSLKRQIQDAIDRMGLLRTARGLKQASAARGKNVTLQTLDTSLNPVTKLRIQEFVPQSEMGKAQIAWPSIDYKHLQNAFQKAVNAQINAVKNDPKLSTRERRRKLPFVTSAASKLFSDHVVSKNLGKGQPLTKEQLNTLLSDLGDTELALRIKQEVNQLVPQLSTKNCETYYSQEEVVEHLRYQIVTGKCSEEEADQLVEGIGKVQNHEGTHISKAELDSLNLPGLLPDTLTPYYSSSELELENQNLPLIETILRDAGVSETAFAFKTGLDNTLEIKGGKILRSLGLEKHVATKHEARFQQTELLSKKSPEGIGSVWIEGREFPRTEWNNWLDVKNRYAVASAKGSVSQSLQMEYDLRKKEVMGIGNLESIQEQVLIDTVLGAGDSHINQYKLDTEGNLKTFDFARLMAASATYEKEGLSHLSIRSEFLQHPIANEKMSPALIQKVLDWDTKEILAQWEKEGLLETEEFFKKREDALSEMRRDQLSLSDPQLTRSEMDALCQKYSLPPGSKRKQVEKAIQERYYKTKKECFEKIHPRAVQDWEKRVTRMQSYLSSESHPTLRGAWEASNKELVPFYRALERTTAHAGNAMVLRSTTKHKMEAEKSKIETLHREISHTIPSSAENTHKAHPTPPVQGMSPEELEKCRLTLSGGKFQTTSEGTLDSGSTQAKAHLFVLGNNQEFYVAPYEKGKMEHSNFFGGDTPPPVCGEMLFDQGKLIALNAMSKQHPQNDMKMLDALQALRTRLAPIDFMNIKVYFSDGKSLYGLDAVTYLQKKIHTDQFEPFKASNPLESIIIEAEEKGVMSPDEIQELKQALLNVKKTSVSCNMIRTTYPAV